MTTPADQVTIGTLSKRVGVHIETIRYYEKIGLMAKPPRTAGGHRIYDPAHTRRLAFIKRGRDRQTPQNPTESPTDTVFSVNS